jgi:aspartate 4-decarboxylase
LGISTGAQGYTRAELNKLEDPKIKAFFVVNPGNPTGAAMS